MTLTATISFPNMAISQMASHRERITSQQPLDNIILGADNIILIADNVSLRDQTGV